MLRAVDAALATLQEEDAMLELEQVFDGFDPARYDREASERWGDSDAYRESARRTKGYTAEDWKRYRAENEAIMRDAAAAMGAGGQPTDAQVMDIAD